MSAVFETSGLCFSYGEHAALRDLSLTIEEGARIALLGSNGSGKSTLLRVLDGLLTPLNGSVRYRGAPLTSEALEEDSFVFDFRRKVALLFQDPDVQLFNPTVFDEIAFGPLQLRWPEGRIRAAVEEQLQTMQIQALRDRAPYQLSGGEKKRVALASILVLEPEVLLLDEPIAALDPRSQDELIALLCSLGSDRTIVTATHDLDILADIADYCYVMQAGTIVGEGTPERVLNDRALLTMANLIGTHPHRALLP